MNVREEAKVGQLETRHSHAKARDGGGIKLSFIRPGKPVENAFAESTGGRLSDECLNINWFMSVRHAREIIETWRQDYNEVRPHSSLKGRTPKEFADSMPGLS